MSRPNILIVTLDSVRADGCSLPGDAGPATTPFLRSLATESTVFRQAIAPSIWTLPVHASVFTGLYPPEHGVETGVEVLGDRPTLAERLEAAGYATGACYRNPYLDAGDVLRGFEVAERVEGTDGDPGPTARAVARLREAHDDDVDAIRESMAADSSLRELAAAWSNDSDTTLGPDRRTVERALSALDATDAPFCWFVHLNDAHWRYTPPAPHHRTFTRRDPAALAFNVGYWQNYVYGSRTNRLETIAGDRTVPAREVRTFRDLYRGCIRHCDAMLRALVEGLKRAGRWEETVLVVLGDHGDAFGEGGVFGHDLSVHDSLLRVPLVVRDPSGHLAPGRVESPVSLVDLYPTLLAIAGTSGPDSDAVDLATGSRDVACTYYDISGHDYYRNAPERGIDHARLPPPEQWSLWRSETAKLIYYPGPDRFDGPAAEDGSLRERLREHAAQLDHVPPEPRALDAGVKRRLEELGYLDSWR